jgi:glycerate 2-kinase
VWQHPGVPSSPRLLAAPDKFHGTATAAEVARAIGQAGRELGWTVDEAPLADGGEGTLEAIGGERRQTQVTGPLGRPVLAEWRLLDNLSVPAGPRAAPPPPGPTAVIEAARAVGRALVPAPTGDDPMAAATTGVGELVLAAVAAGARQIVIGLGGTAATDGGWGAVCAIGSPARLEGARLIVACDVDVPFGSAAAIFGPQKGATPTQVEALGRRLAQLRVRYRDEWGVDVEQLAGGGAAGGLGGGLAALGATLVPGFELVAGVVGIAKRVRDADLVVTGEGRLDWTSFRGKVVGGVAAAARERAPVLCVVGEVAPDFELGRFAAAGEIEVVSLVDTVGPQRAWEDTATAVAAVVAGRLSAR